MDGVNDTNLTNALGLTNQEGLDNSSIVSHSPGPPVLGSVFPSDPPARLLRNDTMDDLIEPNLAGTVCYSASSQSALDTTAIHSSTGQVIDLTLTSSDDEG